MPTAVVGPNPQRQEGGAIFNFSIWFVIICAILKWTAPIAPLLLLPSIVVGTTDPFVHQATRKVELAVA